MKQLFPVLILSLSFGWGAFQAPASAAEIGISLEKIRALSSKAQALSVHQKFQRIKPGPKQIKVLEEHADQLRKLLRANGPSPEDKLWGNLIAPLNRCTDLVRKVCGVNKQCGDSAPCGLAVRLLDRYNDQPTPEAQHESEWSCIASLDDEVFFPACQ